MLDNAFFGENGLTSTSANHIANIAKEYVEELEQYLNNIHFVNHYVGLVGQDAKLFAKGKDEDDIDNIDDMLSNIISAKSLCAWLREAIKEKQRYTKEVDNMNLRTYIEDVCKKEFINAPDCCQSLTRNDIINDMSIGDREKIYTLETKCAVIGKYIHPDGSISKARKELFKRNDNPAESDGFGRDMIIHTYEASIDGETVDNMFFQLQNKHRSYQAELNKINHDIDEKIRLDEIEKQNAYNDEYGKYSEKKALWINEFNEWRKKELDRVVKLKIVIPDRLKSIYETINSIGK